MCYNRTKAVETCINTGFLAVFGWTQFAQKLHIHSKSEVKFISLFVFHTAFDIRLATFDKHS